MSNQENKELQLIDWPSTSDIVEKAVEKLQRRANLQDDYTLLSSQEAGALSPELHETVNAVINEYAISDLLDELLYQAQDDAAETVIERLPQESHEILTKAVRDRDRERG